MVTNGSSTGGEHSITYRDVESLCCTPETNITLCVTYTQKKNFNLKIHEFMYFKQTGKICCILLDILRVITSLLLIKKKKSLKEGLSEGCSRD